MVRTLQLRNFQKLGIILRSSTILDYSRIIICYFSRDSYCSNFVVVVVVILFRYKVEVFVMVVLYFVFCILSTYSQIARK